MKVLLIGFRGAGKTTLGEALAKELGLAFKDADLEIERKEGKTIREIVEKEGWSYFRDLEKAFLKELLKERELVCALGGGAVLHAEEMEALKKESLIIWVKAPLQVLYERILKDEKSHSQRPPLSCLDLKSEIEKVYQEREPLYKKYAHLEVDTSKFSVEELLRFLKEEVLKFFGRKGHG